MSMAVVWAAPPKAEAAAKPITPTIRVRFGPTMSLIRPPRRRKPPNPSV